VQSAEFLVTNSNVKYEIDCQNGLQNSMPDIDKFDSKSEQNNIDYSDKVMEDVCDFKDNIKQELDEVKNGVSNFEVL